MRQKRRDDEFVVLQDQVPTYFRSVKGALSRASLQKLKSAKTHFTATETD